MDYIREARNLFPLNEKHLIEYSRPFPIGVFGTLRKLPRPCGNSHLMDEYTHPPVFIQRGFLPHFIPNGLTLDFCPGASGAFEIFWYEPEHFDEVIAPIDHLESFVPGRKPRWYERTLVEMKIIPADYRELDGPHADIIDDVFNEGLNMRDRDIGIPEDDWHFACCPVWVYSNPEANEECMEVFSEKDDGAAFFEGRPSRSVYQNPILWRGSETKMPKKETQ